jgi:two-component system invasion response regulator UvrY
MTMYALPSAEVQHLACLYLTSKEIRYLRILCSDCSYKEIAAVLKVSKRTVEAYKNILCEKIQVKSRVGLVMYAVRTGIVTPETDCLLIHAS